MKDQITLWIAMMLAFFILFLSQGYIVGRLDKMEKTVDDTNAVITMVFKPAE